MPADGKATATLTDRDVRFLIDRLPSLPGTGDDRRPVTLDLTGGELLVRAREEGRHGRRTGDRPRRDPRESDLRVRPAGSSRGPCRWAARGSSPTTPRNPCGLDTPDGAGPNAAIVFATLAGDPVPAEDAVRIAAEANEQDPKENHAPPAATARGRITPTTTSKRNDAPMPKNRIADHVNGYATNGSTNGHAVRGIDEPNAAPDHDALLERVSALGSTLSEAAGEARSLATDLRKLKRRNRAVTGALAGAEEARLPRRLNVSHHHHE